MLSDLGDDELESIGPLWLRSPFGIGLNDAHVIVEMDASGSAAREGTLTLGDLITAVDGIELGPNISFTEALDPRVELHLLQALRLGTVSGFGSEWLWVARTCELELPMGIGLDEENCITEIKPTGNAAKLGSLRVVSPLHPHDAPLCHSFLCTSADGGGARVACRATTSSRWTAWTCIWASCRSPRHLTRCARADGPPHPSPSVITASLSLPEAPFPHNRLGAACDGGYEFTQR